MISLAPSLVGLLDFAHFSNSFNFDFESSLIQSALRRWESVDVLESIDKFPQTFFAQRVNLSFVSTTPSNGLLSAA